MNYNCYIHSNHYLDEALCCPILMQGSSTNKLHLFLLLHKLLHKLWGIKVSLVSVVYLQNHSLTLRLSIKGYFSVPVSVTCISTWYLMLMKPLSWFLKTHLNFFRWILIYPCVIDPNSISYTYTYHIWIPFPRIYRNLFVYIGI